MNFVVKNIKNVRDRLFETNTELPDFLIYEREQQKLMTTEKQLVFCKKITNKVDENVNKCNIKSRNLLYVLY